MGYLIGAIITSLITIYNAVLVAIMFLLVLFAMIIDTILESIGMTDISGFEIAGVMVLIVIIGVFYTKARAKKN